MSPDLKKALDELGVVPFKAPPVVVKVPFKAPIWKPEYPNQEPPF